MRKKRFTSHKKRGVRGRQGQRTKTGPVVTPVLTTQILQLLYTEAAPIDSKQIMKQLALPLGTRKELHHQLMQLTAANILKQLDNNLFGPGKQHGLAEGMLEQNPKGFGFVSSLSSKLPGPAYQRDAFVSPANMHGARHGDTVLVRIFNVKKDGRPEAEVISVLQRGSDRMAGFVTFKSGRTIVYPEDTRHPFTVYIPGQPDKDLKEGDAVVVKLQDEGGSATSIEGSIIEILGSPESVDVQMRLVIEKHSLPHIFSDETIAQVEKIDESITPSANRLDLRDIQHVTIDGETAKDFDDAVAVIKKRKGYRLYVSIADVSHYVPQGSPLDQDAYQRGTSIYFPGRVIPMLPEKLSNHLCSLVPDNDRYAFTAILDFTRDGRLTHKEFAKSIICSRKRFTYTTVRKILVDRDKEAIQEHKPFLTPLKWAGELAAELMSLREKRGSIGFTIPEPFMELDENGRIKSISRSERNFAHQIIEEFMLAANEAVAETFTENTLNGLYRIHEKPAPEKVEEFVSFGRSLGLDLPPLREDPDWFGQVIKLVQGTPKEYVINNLLLRAMQQARYDRDNVGHFGLATADYTHFTSPIRRYPDLTVHRTLHSFLTRNNKIRTRPKETIPLKEMGTFLSTRERVAVTAEREMNDRLKVRFMHSRIGDTFAAVISGVTGSALFIELLDLFVSGGISLTTLKDDHYIFDARHHRLVGKHLHKSFQIGDMIQVVLLDVDLRNNRIYFGPAPVTDSEETAVDDSKKRRRPKH